jgi:acyl-CoA synthetase (AMP-forming)/AMP-acid ligase II
VIVVDEDEVAERAAALAADWGWLAPGDAVAVRAGNTVGFVAARDAATALGLWFVPVNPKLAPPEVEHIVRTSGARLLVDDPIGGRGVAAAARPSAAGATILFTSGTTGWPKGCLRPEAVEAARLAEMTASYGITSDDVHLVACPLAHSAPGAFLRAARLAGARTVLLPRFDAAAFVDAVRATGATFCFLVPTQVERLLAHGGDLAPLRAVIVAGAPFAPAARARFVDRLGPGKLFEFYGSSETGTISVAPPSAQPAEGGFVGWPPPGVEVEVVEPREDGVGELQVRSAACMTGYLGEPPLAPGAWVTVGDLGRRTADGGVVLVDRRGDLILTGGVNVYPAEVERALLAHPAVRGAVVFGRPHPDWGEEVCALVAADAGEPELRAFLRERIAGYKIPKVFSFVALEELPIGASGKPLRRRARDLVSR